MGAGFERGVPQNDVLFIESEKGVPGVEKVCGEPRGEAKGVRCRLSFQAFAVSR
jgi:hypothetical protein